MLGELEVESRLESLPVIADFLAGALERLGADQAIARRVQLVVDEACTNIIKHAYSGGAGPIKLALELAGSDLIISIQDRGRPFDPARVPPPDLTSDVEDRRPGGLGVYFMKKLMDEVHYAFDESGGNILTLRKRLVK